MFSHFVQINLLKKTIIRFSLFWLITLTSTSSIPSLHAIADYEKGTIKLPQKHLSIKSLFKVSSMLLLTNQTNAFMPQLPSKTINIIAPNSDYLSTKNEFKLKMNQENNNDDETNNPNRNIVDVIKKSLYDTSVLDLLRKSD